MVPVAGHTTCGPDDKSTCARDGLCDGAGACRKWATGTICAAGSCNATTNMVTSPSTCDGKGTCQPGGTLTCAPYVCKDATSCWPSCTTGAQCSGSNSCANHSCGLKVNGTPCGGNSECSSAFCVDGFCCDMQCNGQCQACDLGGSNNGKCQTVTSGQPHGTRPGCNGANVSNNVCAGQCDGSFAGKCDYAGSGTTCVQQSCADSTHEQQAQGCNGNGSCNSGTPISCGQFICSGSACLTSCTKASDCSAGANSVYCNSGSCSPLLTQNATCTISSSCDTGCC
jgi:hypothetical protein